MGASKEYFLIIREHEYLDVPEQFRPRLTFQDNDYNLYKDNELFKAAYSKYKKAKKELEEIKFNLRHERNAG